jgi:Tol biopolymer transport system component/tRNA A-37 threonylcarbamoyl transferase component Bud32
MDPEHWQQIKQILEQVLSRPPADLDAYLDSACAGNKELRHEVEYYLACSREPGAQSFLNHRSDELAAAAAGFVGVGAAELASGTRVASYVIEALRGFGGMGVVYRARDEKLRRQVAIKILAPGVLHGDDARRRFLTEARALAQINHPNILTVYDVDRSENMDFIAMEWADGKSMDQLIGGGGMPLDEALNYGIQIAAAVAHAHAKGIIHRDLKPSNVMITDAGLVKVLDFGLAKLAGKTGSEESTNDDTSITARGRVLGTAAYMSPEQAQGKKVDWRSDVFSFGSLLYEMISGRRAFSGDSKMGTIAAIIKEQPVALDARVPARVRALVERCLRKDPERRFHAMADVKVELEEITEELNAARRSQGTKTFDARVKRFAAAASFLAVAAIAAFVLWRFWLNGPSDLKLPEFEVIQVTSGATWEGEPEISPDGGRIAFVSDASGNLDIYVTDIRGTGQQRITAGPGDHTHPAWFPDGSAIAYSTKRDGKMAIWKTGTLGGGATLLIENAMCPAISPDQTRIAFARTSPGGSRIAVAALDNPTKISVLTDSSEESVSAINPRWSPDSNKICYVDRQDLWIVDAAGGRPRRLTSDGLYKDEPAWSHDARWIYYSAYQAWAYAVWRISSAGGTPERVTDGSAHESHPSVSKDGTRLVYATDSTERGIVVVDTHSGEKSLVPGRQWLMPSISRDGTRIVFVSTRSGSGDSLWVQALAEGKPVGTPNLLAGLVEGVLSHPAISPDGQWIACYRILGNRREILTIPASGGPPIQFTLDPPPSYHPSWSPDGSMIAFATKTNKGSEIRIARAVNGEPAGGFRKIATSDASDWAPTWSPDGTALAFIEERNDQGEVWTAPADGRTPARQITRGANAQRVRWDAATGDLLVSGHWGEEMVILRRVSVATGVASEFEPKVEFGGKRSWGLFDISADGRWLVFSKEEIAGHVWMLKSTKGLF